MSEERNTFYVVEEHLQQYLDLYVKKDCDSDTLCRAYEKLKEVITVEIYFMKKVRFIVPDDELSGFILSFLEQLDPLIHSYDSTKGSFYSYLATALERRAYVYMRKIKDFNDLERCYTKYYMPYDDNMIASERTPEEYLLEKVDDEHNNPFRSVLPRDKLRYICAKKPIRQKKIFLFLCTQLPFLPTDLIESICTSLNYDMNQTFSIAQKLTLSVLEPKSSRYSLEYFSTRRTYFWAKKLELENEIRKGRNNEKNMKKLTLNTGRLENAQVHEKSMKKRVCDSEVCRILNIQNSSLKTAVRESRELLQMVCSEDYEESIAKILDTDEKEILGTQARLFEPYKVFGLSCGQT